jgi:UDP-4-amino-4,6-dideoxy-N-acetyl-beta-L-altrosamine transaminase
MINYGRQNISDEDIAAVVEVLKSDYLTQGPKVEEFEEKFADYCGSKYAVAVSNGTAALHLANIVAGTSKNDNILTTPISFLATSNSIVYARGNPIFCDIIEKKFTIDPFEIEKQLKNKKAKGIIPVHLGGVVCDMEKINKIAKQNNLWIIEDACHALGGTWKDSSNSLQKVGNCSHSDMTTFSFHPVKHITTGEGGVITTNNELYYKKLKNLRSHGMTKRNHQNEKTSSPWYYEMHEVGFNYRITDFQAALGIEQLKKSNHWINKRNEMVMKYDEEFYDLEEIFAQRHPKNSGNFSYHLYIIQCDDRKRLYHYLLKHGVNTQVHYIPIHLQPYYKSFFGYKRGDFPKAEHYYRKALSLPLHPSLKENEQNKVIDLIKRFYLKNSRKLT